MTLQNLFPDTEPLRLRKWTTEYEAAGGRHMPRVPIHDLPRVEVIVLAEHHETGPVDMDQLRRDLSTRQTPSRPLNLSPRRKRGVRGLAAWLRGQR